MPELMQLAKDCNAHTFGHGVTLFFNGVRYADELVVYIIRLFVLISDTKQRTDSE